MDEDLAHELAQIVGDKGTSAESRAASLDLAWRVRSGDQVRAGVGRSRAVLMQRCNVALDPCWPHPPAGSAAAQSLPVL